jgi:hypothetical protein
MNHNPPTFLSIFMQHKQIISDCIFDDLHIVPYILLLLFSYQQLIPCIFLQLNMVTTTLIERFTNEPGFLFRTLSVTAFIILFLWSEWQHSSSPILFTPLLFTPLIFLLIMSGWHGHRWHWHPGKLLWHWVSTREAGEPSVILIHSIKG